MTYKKEGIFYEDKVLSNVDKTKYDYEHPTNYLQGGSQFLGWYLSSDFSGDPVNLNDPAKLTMPYSDLYLYAKWTDPKYTVTFDSRGGSEVAAQTGLERGQTATEPTDPTRDGYAFVGWVDENNNPWAFEQEITRDITLYAVWRPIANTRYTVRHIYVDGHNGEHPFYELSNQTGRIGDTITARALNNTDSAYTEGMKKLGVTGLYLLPDATTKSLVLSDNAVDNVIAFYYATSPERDYVVHYYLEGTTTRVQADKNVTGKEYSMVTEQAPKISDYTLVTDGLTLYDSNYYKTAALKSRSEGKNEIIFYYRPVAKTAVIAPADVTIYMGGNGYEGAVNQGGTGLESTNGFPEPGFVIVTPSGVKDFDPTQATLKYVDNEASINRSWKIVSYDGKTGHNIYRFVPQSTADAVQNGGRNHRESGRVHHSGPSGSGPHHGGLRRRRERRKCQIGV